MFLPGRAARNGAQHRRDAEGRDAEHEHAPWPEDAAEGTADVEQRAEREQVGVDDPPLQHEPSAEVVLDRGERHVDDAAADKDDAGAQDAGDQDEPVARRACQVSDTRRPEAGGSGVGSTGARRSRRATGEYQVNTGSRGIAACRSGSYGHRHKEQEELVLVLCREAPAQARRRGGLAGLRVSPRGAIRAGPLCGGPVAAGVDSIDLAVEGIVDRISGITMRIKQAHEEVLRETGPRIPTSASSRICGSTPRTGAARPGSSPPTSSSRAAP